MSPEVLELAVQSLWVFFLVYGEKVAHEEEHFILFTAELPLWTSLHLQTTGRVQFH